MPLKLTLKPGERFVLNGAVIVNGDKRSSLVIQNQACILRERDILREDEVDTPAKRIYFPIMMMYLEPTARSDWYDEFVIRMTEFMGVVTSPDLMASCLAVSRDVMENNLYPALTKCRQLIALEGERLANVVTGVSSDSEDSRKSA
ncbi:MAG: flagellar biosynthesis repressor FlbT [Pseudomonadota bacterium]